MRRLPLLCVVTLAGVTAPTMTLQAADLPLKVPMPADRAAAAFQEASQLYENRNYRALDEP